MMAKPYEELQPELRKIDEARARAFARKQEKAAQFPLPNPATTAGVRRFGQQGLQLQEQEVGLNRNIQGVQPIPVLSGMQDAAARRDYEATRARTLTPLMLAGAPALAASGRATGGVGVPPGTTGRGQVAIQRPDIQVAQEGAQATRPGVPEIELANPAGPVSIPSRFAVSPSGLDRGTIMAGNTGLRRLARGEVEPGSGSVTPLAGRAADQPGYAQLTNEQRIAANVRALNADRDAIVASLPSRQRATGTSVDVGGPSDYMTELQRRNERVGREAAMELALGRVKNMGLGARGRAAVTEQILKQYGPNQEVGAQTAQNDVANRLAVGKLDLLGQELGQNRELELARLSSAERAAQSGAAAIPKLEAFKSALRMDEDRAKSVLERQRAADKEVGEIQKNLIEKLGVNSAAADVTTAASLILSLNQILSKEQATNLVAEVLATNPELTGSELRAAVTAEAKRRSGQ